MLPMLQAGIAVHHSGKLSTLAAYTAVMSWLLVFLHDAVSAHMASWIVQDCSPS